MSDVNGKLFVLKREAVKFEELQQQLPWRDCVQIVAPVD